MTEPNIAIDDITTFDGKSIVELSHQKGILLVFLRQVNCLFCRQAMSELGKNRAAIETRKVQIVFVTLNTETDIAPLLRKYNLSGCAVVVDPEMRFYARFGLLKANNSQIMGLTSWVKTVTVGINYGLHRPLGDAFQMPGIFLIQNGVIIQTFRHKDIYDQPDYVQFAACCDI